jgi:hypothetical protein
VNVHSVNATFSDGKLVSITGFISSDDFSTLIAAMAERFGKRAKVTEGRVQNRWELCSARAPYAGRPTTHGCRSKSASLGSRTKEWSTSVQLPGTPFPTVKFKESTREGAKDL